MSLLLDALRKSEKRRQGGTPPPLGLPTGPGASPRPGRRSPARRLGLALLLLVGLFAIVAAAWWGAGRPGEDRLRAWLAPEADSSSMPAAPAEDAEDVDESERRLVADDYRRPAEPTPPPEAPLGRESGTAADSAGETDRPPPVQPARTPTAASVEPVSDPVSDPSPETTVADSSAGPRGGAIPVPEPTQPSADPSRAASSPEPIATAAVPESRTPAEVAAEERAARDGSVLPWELPAAVRADFPSIEVAVHVYAPRPEDRFVLIAGERYGEGDSLEGGVRLVEIRRSGIVVEFQAYRVRIE